MWDRRPIYVLPCISKTRDCIMCNCLYKYIIVSKYQSMVHFNQTFIKYRKKLLICINKCISIKSFQYELKVADVIPVFKKEDPNNKVNYRPISLLPITSKIFERALFEEIGKLSEKIFLVKIPLFYYQTL